jgi:hypothetical protein
MATSLACPLPLLPALSPPEAAWLPHAVRKSSEAAADKASRTFRFPFI